MRNIESDLRAILKPFIHTSEEEKWIIFAPIPEFIALNKQKYYIVKTKDISEFEAPLCPECHDSTKHKGFMALVFQREEKQYYVVYQPDLPCPCRNITLYLGNQFFK